MRDRAECWSQEAVQIGILVTRQDSFPLPLGLERVKRADDEALAVAGEQGEDGNDSRAVGDVAEQVQALVCAHEGEYDKRHRSADRGSHPERELRGPSPAIGRPRRG